MMTNFDQIIQKYISICHKYGVEVQVTLTGGDGERQTVHGNQIMLNTDKIPADAFEAYLACDIRKVLLPQMVLETNRLLLRRARPSDAEDCFAFLSDRRTCYDDGGYEPFRERDEAYGRLMDELVHQDMRKMLVLKDSGRVIGTVNLFDAPDRVVETYEIGYVVSPGYRRRGYAYEAVSALCGCLLGELHADMVIAGAIERNTASLHLLEKLGFRFEGRRTKGFSHPELGAVDLLYYVKEREPSDKGEQT